MSTAHTTPSDGGRGRRRPWSVGRHRSATDPAARVHPDRERDAEESRGAGRSALLRHCRREGRTAARRRMFDPLVLAGDGLPPRLAELAAERDRARHRLMRRAAADQEAAERAAGQAEAESTAAASAARRGAEAIAEAAERLDVARAQLDRLADRAARRAEARDTLARWTAQRRIDPAHPGHSPGHAPNPAAAHARWEGASSETSMSHRGTLALLLCLALVELPIYWSVFRRLHGTGDPASNLLTGTFTFAVGTLMIVVPHVLGRLLRARRATGATSLLVLPSTVLLGAWVYACWTLGELRTSLLTEERAPLVGPELERYLPEQSRERPSVLAELGISEQTMSLMFVALLLLSGGVAFVLGLGRAHPYLAAYRAGHAERERLAASEQAATLAAEQARARAETRPAEDHARREALDAALREVDELYEAAAHAYVDGVATGSRDPVLTEAAMRLSGRWPLLPRPAAP